MKNINAKLITEEICSKVTQTLDISDFAKLTSHGDLEDCGLIIDQDMSLLGDFKSYNINKNKAKDSISSVNKSLPHNRNLKSRDTFIKPIFKLSIDEKDDVENSIITFSAPQVLLNENYQKRLDTFLKNGKLDISSRFEMITDKNKYEIIMYKFKNNEIAKVPNQLLNTNEKGHTWFLTTKIKGVVTKINEEYYFVPDKVLFSGIPYINIKSFMNTSVENIVRKR